LLARSQVMLQKRTHVTAKVWTSQMQLKPFANM
jgi:hypothetical protein